MSSEKKPTWVTVVAVIAMIFSGFGLFGATQEMTMSLTADFQKQMIQQQKELFVQEMERYQTPDDPTLEGLHNFILEMYELMESMYDFPDWYQTWMIISGILSLAIYGFFLFAAIRFMQLRRNAVVLMYIALPMSIALSGVKISMAAKALTGLVTMIIAMGSIGIVVELVLLIVILTANKECFTK